MQDFLSLTLGVLALVSVTGDQSFVISDRVQRRHKGIGNAMKK